METATLKQLGLALSHDVVDAHDELVELRRELHRHPELSFQERRTQSVVLERMKAAGVEAREMAGTGVVGMIRGAEPGPTVLVRADMDALPVTEENEVPYASENPGVMHACGHDAHTAMLLVLARLLAARGLERGAVMLVFQPAEEGEGGAARMIEEGLLDGEAVDAAFAFHVWSPQPIGEVVVVDGPVAASVDGFEIEVVGKGTHGARPEEGVDPIAIGAQIVSAAQSLVSRRVGPWDPAVLSFTAFNAGNAFNVIPERATLLGTFRTFDAAVRSEIRRGLEELARSTARAFGGSASYRSLVEHEPTVNDAAVAEQLRAAARGVVGDDRLLPGHPLMVGEDFGEITARVPGALALLGCGNPEIGASHPHHHPRFDIDERVLPVGVEIGLKAVERLLLKK